MPSSNEPYILGFSDSVHDRSITIFKGNRPLVAIEEERLSRIKHGIKLYRESRNNPALFSNMNLENSGADENEQRLMPSVQYCLDALGITLEDISIIIGNSLHIAFPFRRKAIYINHHLAHAASAFFASGFEDAAILLADGYGDITESQSYETVMLAQGAGNQLKVLGTVGGRVTTYYDMENSIGVFYRIGTLLSGFGVFDEGKAMGLSAYGEPRHLSLVRQHITFKDSTVLINNRAIWDTCIEKLGRPTDFQARADIAATFQKLLEEMVFHYADYLHRATGSQNLCIAGGVGLNCVSNANLLKRSKFERVFVFPAAGDNGISFGAAYYAAHSILGLPRTEQLDHAYFGRSYTPPEIEACLKSSADRLSYEPLGLERAALKAAELLRDEQVLMWFQEGAEIGPRALGHRSILASPLRVETKDYINSSVKFRELFRPLAPMVLEEDAAQYFDCPAASPFMLFSPQTKLAARHAAPAIVHHDGTARLQTISRRANPTVHQLISEFKRMTGVPIVLNTSFNGKDEPIVETPQQALDCFLRSSVQYLFMDGYIIKKKENCQ